MGSSGSGGGKLGSTSSTSGTVLLGIFILAFFAFAGPFPPFK